MTGFPWVPLGNSQIDVTPIAQAASLIGVYGLSALVVARQRGARLDRRRAAGPRPRGAGGGGRRADRGPGRAGARRASSRRRSAARRHAGPRRARPGQRRAGPEVGRRLRRRDLSPLPGAVARRPWRRGATLVVWPESATPFMFEEHPAAEAMRLLARETGARLFIGSDQVERAARRATTTAPSSSSRPGRSAASTARSTWCRSASTCRSSRSCRSPGRSSSRSAASRRARR